MFVNENVWADNGMRVNSRVILGAERRTGDMSYGNKLYEKGGFNGIIVDTIHGVGTDAHDKADKTSIIGDRIFFGHTYEDDVAGKKNGWEIKSWQGHGNLKIYPVGENDRKGGSQMISGDFIFIDQFGNYQSVKQLLTALCTMWGHWKNDMTPVMVRNRQNANVNDTLRQGVARWGGFANRGE